MSPPKKSRKRALCAENQAALDYLIAESEKPRFQGDKSTNYGRLFGRAIKNFALYEEPVKSLRDALAIDGIGNFVGAIIARGLKDADVTHGSGKKRKASTALDDSVSSSATKPLKTPKIPTDQESKLMIKKLRKQSIVEEKKEALKNAQTRTEKIILPNLHKYTKWKVVLLLDKAEPNVEETQARLAQRGITVEKRGLPIGDMLWIVRGVNSSNNATVELILGTVIERKNANDLISSIYGTRFKEQRLRLKYSAAGASQVIYLFEAREIKDLPNANAQTQRTALMQTMIHLGFAIVRTKNLDDTVKWLQRIHRRIILRAFPQQRMDQFFVSPQGIRRRHIRQVPQEFNELPIPIDNSDRFHSYEEFKSKVEYAREKAKNNLQLIYQAQMLQIKGVGQNKITAIAQKYPTPKSLFEAYKVSKQPESMLKDINTNEISLKKCTVGSKCSNDFRKVYTTLPGEDKSISILSYAEKVQRHINSQNSSDAGTNLDVVVNEVSNKGRMSKSKKSSPNKTSNNVRSDRIALAKGKSSLSSRISQGEKGQEKIISHYSSERDSTPNLTVKASNKGRARESKISSTYEASQESEQNFAFAVTEHTNEHNKTVRVQQIVKVSSKSKASKFCFDLTQDSFDDVSIEHTGDGRQTPSTCANQSQDGDSGFNYDHASGQTFPESPKILKMNKSKSAPSAHKSQLHDSQFIGFGFEDVTGDKPSLFESKISKVSDQRSQFQNDNDSDFDYEDITGDKPESSLETDVLESTSSNISPSRELQLQSQKRSEFVPDSYDLTEDGSHDEMIVTKRLLETTQTSKKMVSPKKPDTVNYLPSAQGTFCDKMELQQGRKESFDLVGAVTKVVSQTFNQKSGSYDLTLDEDDETGIEVPKLSKGGRNVSRGSSFSNTKRSKNDGKADLLYDDSSDDDSNLLTYKPQKLNKKESNTSIKSSDQYEDDVIDLC